MTSTCPSVVESQRLDGTTATASRPDSSAPQARHASAPQAVRTPTTPAAPDGGWGWMCVAGSCFIQIIFGGLPFGVIFVHLKTWLHSSVTGASAIGGLNQTIGLISGPLVAVVQKNFSHRMMAVAGTLITVIGWLPCAFTTSTGLTFIGFSLLGGIGSAFVTIASTIIVCEYFDKRRGLALGIANAGYGLGTAALPPLIEQLFDIYGYRGAFIINSAILLNMLVSAALFRPLVVSDPKHPRIIDTYTVSDITADCIEPNVQNDDSATTGVTYLFQHGTDELTELEKAGRTLDGATREDIEDSANACDARMLNYKDAKARKHLPTTHDVPSTTEDDERYLQTDQETEYYSNTNEDSYKQVNNRTRVDHKSFHSRGRPTSLVLPTNSGILVRDSYSPIAELQLSSGYSSKVKAGNDGARYQDTFRKKSNDTHSLNEHLSTYSSDSNDERKLLYPNRRPDKLHSRFQSFRHRCQMCILCIIDYMTSPSQISVICFNVSTMPMAAAYASTQILIVAQAIEQGIEKDTAVWLLSIGGIAYLVGSVLSFLFDVVHGASRCNFYVFLLVVFGISICGLGYCRTFVQFTIASIGCGVTNAAINTAIPIFLGDLVRIEDLASAYGCNMFFQGIAITIGSVVAGYLKDKTGKYVLSYLLMGLSSCLGGIIFFCGYHWTTPSINMQQDYVTEATKRTK